MFKNNKAITLIALIITIIVLLILAGVTINMVLGENGLFNKAKTSVAKYENDQEKENGVLAGYETEIDNARDTVTIPKEEYEMLINANNYSTDEKKIGTWDGKDLYRKMIKITTPITTETGIYDISDINIVKMYGWKEIKNINDNRTFRCQIESLETSNVYIGWNHSIRQKNQIYVQIFNPEDQLMQAEIIIEYTLK